MSTDQLTAQIAIGKAIKELRKDAGFTQETFSHKLGIDRNNVGYIERGEHNLTLRTLLAYCEILNTTPSEVLKKAGL